MNKSLFDTNLKSLENFILNSAPDISYSNFIIAILVSRFTAPPPKEVQELTERIRTPRGSTSLNGSVH